ncbi:MAG TPA: hypothetical protein VGF38_12530 [Ktedonobacterales bacterium]
MFRMNSCCVTPQAARMTPETSRRGGRIGFGAWRRLAATAMVVSVIAISALSAGWFAPAAHGATTAHHSLAVAPHIVCGALSLPC